MSDAASSSTAWNPTDEELRLLLLWQWAIEGLRSTWARSETNEHFRPNNRKAVRDAITMLDEGMRTLDEDAYPDEPRPDDFREVVDKLIAKAERRQEEHRATCNALIENGQDDAWELDWGVLWEQTTSDLKDLAKTMRAATPAILTADN